MGKVIASYNVTITDHENDPATVDMGGDAPVEVRQTAGVVEPQPLGISTIEASIAVALHDATGRTFKVTATRTDI